MAKNSYLLTEHYIQKKQHLLLQDNFPNLLFHFVKSTNLDV
jgi:hypothetical protein